jgi:hypothetical protein
MTLLVVPFLHFFGGQILQMLNTWFQELRRFFKNKLKSLCKEILKWLEDEDLDGNNVFRREGPEENNNVQRDTGERDTGDTQQGDNATIRRASEEDAAGVENTGTATATEANRTTTQSPPNSPSVRELHIPIADEDSPSVRELRIPIADEALNELPFPFFFTFTYLFFPFTYLMDLLYRRWLNVRVHYRLHLGALIIRLVFYYFVRT